MGHHHWIWSSLDLDHHEASSLDLIIIRSGSSLDLDHHSIWIITRHHHWIWIITAGSSSLDLDHHCWIIITRSGSSLDLDQHHWIGSGSSLDLDHHCWIIIIGYWTSLDLDHHWTSSLYLDYHSNWIIITSAISWFFSSQEVIQSQPFFMLDVGLATM